MGEHLPAPTKHRRWLQFGLGTLLVLVTIVSIWIGSIARSVKAQRDALAAIRQLDSQVNFQHEFIGLETRTPIIIDDPVLPGPVWVRELLGDDYFRTPVAIQIKEDCSDDVLAQLPKLPELFQVLIDGPFTSAGLEHLASLPRLTSLGIRTDRITDADLRHVGKLHQLESLTIDCPRITDAGMGHLQSLRNLHELECVTRSFSQKLRGSTPLEFVRVPLIDCLEYLQEYCQVEFRFDNEALVAAGIDVKPLEISGVHGGPLHEVLDKLLSPHQLGWTTDSQGVVITTVDAADEARKGINDLRRALPKLESAVVDW